MIYALNLIETLFKSFNSSSILNLRFRLFKTLLYCNAKGSYSIYKGIKESIKNLYVFYGRALNKVIIDCNYHGSI